MRDIEDISTPEAAAMLGVTPNAVKIRLHRARQALTTLLRHRFAEAGLVEPAGDTGQMTIAAKTLVSA